MEHKHIDPEPNRRYIIRDPQGQIDSAVVIEATDQHVRLQWDGDGLKAWYPYEWFFPREGDQKYRLRILEQLETPR